MGCGASAPVALAPAAPAPSPPPPPPAAPRAVTGPPVYPPSPEIGLIPTVRSEARSVGFDCANKLFLAFGFEDKTKDVIEAVMGSFEMIPMPEREYMRFGVFGPEIKEPSLPQSDLNAIHAYLYCGFKLHRKLSAIERDFKAEWNSFYLRQINSAAAAGFREGYMKAVERRMSL